MRIAFICALLLGACGGKIDDSSTGDFGSSTTTPPSTTATSDPNPGPGPGGPPKAVPPSQPTSSPTFVPQPPRPAPTTTPTNNPPPPPVPVPTFTTPIPNPPAPPPPRPPEGEGLIACGNTVCKAHVQECCVEVGGGFPTPSCTPVGKCQSSVTLSCSSAQSCPGRQVCCANVNGGNGGGIEATCQRECPGMQLCASPNECENGFCRRTPIGIGICN